MHNIARFKNRVDPFSFITFASVCMGIFRQLHLEETYQVQLKEDASNAAADDWLEGKLWVTKFGWKNLLAGVSLKATKLLERSLWWVSCWCHTFLWVWRWGQLHESFYPIARVGGQEKGSQNPTHTQWRWIQRPDGRFYKGDGFCRDPLTGQKILLDFNRCLFHRCLEFYPEDIIHPHFGQTLKRSHVLTMKMKTDLISIWVTST